MSKSLRKKIRDGEVTLCLICLNYVRNIPGWSISTCREGAVHDLLPISIAPPKPTEATVSDLCQAPDLLTRYIGIKVLPEILLNPKFKR